MITDLVEIIGSDKVEVDGLVGAGIESAHTVKDTLIELDEYNSDYYEKNAAVYSRELEELDSYIKDKALLLTDEQRILITAHDAFNYFARGYDFEVRGLQGFGKT